MKIIRKRGDTSNILQVFIQDSSSTTGAGLTGLAFNTASLTAYYHRDLDTTATAISLATMTVGTFTSSGFKEIDATNMPGWYQFCPPDTAFGSGSAAHSVGFHLKGATNMAPLAIECQLVAVDVEDTVRAGLTALPNVASGSAGAIPTTGTGSNQISVSSGQVILQTGSGTGQLDFTSGVVKANTTQLAAQTVTAAAGVTFPTSVASPTNITAGVITTATNLTNNNDKTGYSIGTGGIAAAAFAAAAIDAAAIAANAIGSSEFSQAAADVVWTSAARTLTASTRVKKNTALAGFMFFMADSADHVTPKTGLTITATRAIDGGAFAGCANSAAEIANGVYKIDLAAADLNGNNIILKFTSAGADQTTILVVTSD